MKGLRTAYGCEAESNDGNIKYILRKVVKFPESGMEQKVFETATFVRMEGNSWEEVSSGSTSFLSVEDFVRSLSKSPEMSQAYSELTEGARLGEDAPHP